MKFINVITKLFFLLFCVNIFANLHVDGIGKDDVMRYKLIDSLYLSKSKVLLSEDEAISIIDSYKNTIENNNNFDENDLQALSVSYAAINSPKKSTEFLDKYIKQTHDFEILNSQYLNNIKKTDSYTHLLNKYKPKINGWIIIYFFGAFVGIFIAVILNFRKKIDNVTIAIISVFIAISALYTINICLYLSNLHYQFPHTLYYTISFNFLFGPLLYFYFKRLTEQHRFRLKDGLHLLPAIIVLLYFTKYYILPKDEKLHLLMNHSEVDDPMLTIVVISKILSFIIYGFLCYRIYKRLYKANISNVSSIVKWIRNLMILYFAYVLSHLLHIVMIFGWVSYDFAINLQIVSMSVMMIYVGYMAYIQPNIFFGKKFLNAYKYQKSGMTESFSEDLKEELLQLLYNDKIYLMNEINLEILSDKLGTTRHNTSQVINEHFNMNFFSLINKFRIEEAQKILKDNYLNSSLNIIDVAYDVGYNNKVTFNKAFKDCTRLTPTQYLKLVQTQNIVI